jgi:hypothetical protein
MPYTTVAVLSERQISNKCALPKADICGEAQNTSLLSQRFYPEF